VTHDDSVSKISVVGLGMAKQTGVAQRMFEALAAAGINIQMITTSEIKISVLVKRSEAQEALKVVHRMFSLQTKPADAKTWTVGQQHNHDLSASDVVERLRHSNMEQLTLLDIDMVGDQARVTLLGVPDTPGLANSVFQHVANAGLFVDMIVQSCDGFQGETSISFTVPEDQMDQCIEVLKATKYQFRKVGGSKDIAKLSVSGIGLRSHTSVAIAMFKALADEGINVLMINTSELRVNVVIDGKDGQRGLACLQKTFKASLI
jgi:aspartate kinase